MCSIQKQVTVKGQSSCTCFALEHQSRIGCSAWASGAPWCIHSNSSREVNSSQLYIWTCISWVESSWHIFSLNPPEWRSLWWILIWTSNSFRPWRQQDKRSNHTGDSRPNWNLATCSHWERHVDRIATTSQIPQFGVARYTTSNTMRGPIGSPLPFVTAQAEARVSPWCPPVKDRSSTSSTLEAWTLQQTEN